MDPLTHTLVGAALAETRLARLGRAAELPRAVAATTLVIGANLPDVDVACYFVGSDFALAHRRGWTHGVLAMVVLPVLLTLIVGGLRAAAARRRRTGGRPVPSPASPGTGWRPLLALSAIGVWSHPLLDWLNTYGVRLLAPFDWTWFYGDALFIADPWIWLLLAGALFLGRSRSVGAIAAWALTATAVTALVLLAAPAAARIAWGLALVLLVLARFRGPLSRTGARRVATAAVAAAGLYVAAMIGSTALGRRVARQGGEAAEPGARVEAVMAGPVAANPFRREVVTRIGDGYRLGTIRWRAGGPVLELAPGTVSGPSPGPLARRALESPAVRGMRTWMRFPTFVTEPAGDGRVRVHIVDLRYARRPASGFGTASVVLEPRVRSLSDPGAGGGLDEDLVLRDVVEEPVP